MKIEEVKRQSIRGVMGFGIRTVGLYAIAIVATGLLSVFLSPEDFGVYYIVTALIGVLTFLSDIGLAASLVQKKEEPTLSELRTVFTVQQILAVLILLLTVGLTPIWRGFLKLNWDGLLLLYAFGFSFVLASLKTIPSIIMERKLKFELLIIPQIVEQVSFYGVAVILAYLGFGITAYTIAIMIRGVLGTLTMYLIQKWPLAYSMSMTELKQLLRFGFKFQLNDLLARLKDDLFIVVLGKFIGVTEMGYLGWAKRWSMFPYQLSVSNIIAILFPTFSRLQHEKQVLSRAIEKSLFFISLIIFPILMGMSVMAYPLIKVIPNYGKWTPALAALYWFCLNIAFAAMANPLINSLNALGKIKKTLKLMIIMTTGTWILSPIGYYWFGFQGIAMVAAIIAMISLYAYRWLKPDLKINLIEPVSRQLGASLIMGMALFLGQSYWQQSVKNFGFGVAWGIIVYVGMMLLFGFKRLKNEWESLIKFSHK